MVNSTLTTWLHSMDQALENERDSEIIGEIIEELKAGARDRELVGHLEAVIRQWFVLPRDMRAVVAAAAPELAEALTALRWEATS